MPRLVSGQNKPRVEAHRPTLVVPGLYDELIAALRNPAVPDDRLSMSITATENPDERAELVELAEAQRQETNSRNRAEL